VTTLPRAAGALSTGPDAGLGAAGFAAALRGGTVRSETGAGRGAEQPAMSVADATSERK
jgi:hypothetical protein